MERQLIVKMQGQLDALAQEMPGEEGSSIEDHFADVSKKVEIGSGAKRSIEDVR